MPGGCPGTGSEHDPVLISSPVSAVSVLEGFSGGPASTATLPAVLSGSTPPTDSASGSAPPTSGVLSSGPACVGLPSPWPPRLLSLSQSPVVDSSLQLVTHLNTETMRLSRRTLVETLHPFSHKDHLFIFSPATSNTTVAYCRGRFYGKPQTG